MANKKRISKTKFSCKKKNLTLGEGLCILCGISSDENYLGQFFSTPEIAVHEHCLLFSPLLNQLHNPDRKRKGYIIGFKIVDIEREAKRVKTLKCVVCRGYRAGIGCHNNACKKSFHLCCGFKQGAIGIFKDIFQFYCADHFSIQDVTTQLKTCDKVVPECTICLESMIDEGYGEESVSKSGNHWTQFLAKIKMRSVINGLCCARCWMHRACIRQYALSAGLHHAKCPNCSDTKTFTDSIQQCGIWLPDRDASWELEPGAYQELYEDPEEPESASLSIEMPEVSDPLITLSPRVLLTDTISEAMLLPLPPPPQIPPRKRTRPSNWSSASSPTKPIKRLRSSDVPETTNAAAICPDTSKTATNNMYITRSVSRNKSKAAYYTRKKLSQEKIDRVVAMLKEGVSGHQIASILRCTKYSVYKIKRDFYNNANHVAPANTNSVGPSEPHKQTSISGKTKSRHMERDKLDECLKMIKDGLTQKEIATIFGCTQQRVSEMKRKSLENSSGIKHRPAYNSDTVKEPKPVKTDPLKHTRSFVGKRTVTRAEVDRCLALLRQGLPQIVIASRLDKTSQWVSRIKMNTKYFLSRDLEPQAAVAEVEESTCSQGSMASDGVSLCLPGGHVVCSCADCGGGVRVEATNE